MKVTRFGLRRKVRYPAEELSPRGIRFKRNTLCQRCLLAWDLALSFGSLEMASLLKMGALLDFTLGLDEAGRSWRVEFAGELSHVTTRGYRPRPQGMIRLS